MSGFKAILPAHGTRDDVSETSTSLSSAVSNTGTSMSTSAEVNRDEEKPKRKRKVQGKVATIACLECRRTRSKCDGDPPNPCARCRTRGYRCVYQPHTKIQKDEILNDLEQERARTESLSQRNHELSMILQVISSDGHLDEIVQRLRKKDDAKSIATWLSSLPELQLSLRKMSMAPSDMEEIVDNLRNMYDIRGTNIKVNTLSAKSWTRVTGDAHFIDHMVGLYLEYVNSGCMLFNEIAFVQSYQTNEGMACSKALLNAICAMSCNILDRKLFKTEQDASNVTQLHEAFLAEARSSISLADSQNLTTIQAMAVMYMADLSSGRSRTANTYLKCASEGLRSLEAELEIVPDIDLSRWGLHSLDTLSCAFTYSNPFSPQTVNLTVTFDSSRELYQQFSKDSETVLHKSSSITLLAIQIAGCKARLCQLVHGMIGLYGGLNGSVTPELVLDCFQGFVNFFNSMPQAVREPTQQSRLTLSIRVLHIKFYSMVSSLWLPLVSFAQAQQNEEMFQSCRQLVLESCQKAVDLIEETLQDGSCERWLPQYTFCALNVCDLVARWSSNRTERLNAIHTCFKLLDGNTMNSKLCGLLKKLFRTELEKFVEPDVMETLKQQYEVHDTCTVEEALDATNRLTYVIPFPSITKWLDEEFQSKWSTAWNAFRTSNPLVRSSSSGTHAMRIEDMCN